MTTTADLNAKVGVLRSLPDYLRRGLDVVFVGFNPSIYAARAGHYYARPANQFWRCLNESGLLPYGVRMEPRDDSRLPLFGLGLTDVVKRPTRSCNDLGTSDYQPGVADLVKKLERCSPRAVAFSGKGVYQKCRRFAGRCQLSARTVELGLQDWRLAGASVFVLPSTSPINARLSVAEKLKYFKRLARWVKRYA